MPAAATTAHGQSWVGKASDRAATVQLAGGAPELAHPPTHAPTHRSSTGAAAGSTAAPGRWRRRGLHSTAGQCSSVARLRPEHSKTTRGASRRCGGTKGSCLPELLHPPEKLTPRSPSGAGPRLDQVYCCPASSSPLHEAARQDRWDRHELLAVPGHAAPVPNPCTVPIHSPQAVACRCQRGADIGANAQHCGGGAPGGAHRAQRGARIACR